MKLYRAAGYYWHALNIKKMKKLILLIITTMISLLFPKGVVAQQDAQLSQYVFNGIYVNPAYAGYREQLNVNAFYHNQWTGIKGAPQTLSLVVDAIANSGNVGLALQVSSDRIGAQRNTAAYANYAYRIRLKGDGSSRLALGVGIGVVQLGIDGALLNPNIPEPDQPSGMQHTIVPDARAGVYYSDNRFFAGFSVDNLIAQYLDVDRFAFVPQSKPHYYLSAGLMLPLSDNIQVKPSFLLKDDRGGPTSLDLSTFLVLGERLWVGGSYRTGVKLYNKSYLLKDLTSRNSAAAAVQVFADQNFRIGYAYGFSVGSLKTNSGGTHEISVGYFFDKKEIRMLSPRNF
jgi:type IX secretion system PorP/SprF family membrane protein